MSHYETPTYKVIKKDGAIEIRRYDEFKTTSVTENKLSGYNGFDHLFGYISGNNETHEKISMTVPVINELSPDSQSMEFVVPGKFKNAAPKPTDPLLTTKVYPAHFAAALIFSGSAAHEKLVDKKVGELASWLKKNNLKSRGKVRLARFNMPFSLPFLRHNEVIFELNLPEDYQFKD
ncbi:MAG: heme-binding protein [Firmicutes bacterium]|nr:heme-binding protein [Bacillota bacterium]